MQLPLLDLTFQQLDQFLGSNAQSLVGGNPFLGGALVSLFFLLLAFKMGLGIEGTIVIGAFMVVMLTISIANTGGLIPMVILSLIVIGSAILWYKAFYSSDFRF
jgi:hypothetical protein